MSKRDYDRLPIERFGRHLLISGDLDPVYIALHGLKFAGKWDEDQVKRWLVAYWCLYHCGAASYISTFTGEDFWVQLGKAALNAEPAPNGGRWPRGHERRHWRGQQATKSCYELRAKHPVPETMVDAICSGGHEFVSVATRAKSYRGFGDWIAFKVCDMLDRVMGHKVDFTEAAVFMFRDPEQAALRLWRERLGLPENARPKDKREAIHIVVGHLETTFAGMTAPPLHDRPVELQEIETVLCKWKSHMNGHYPLNNDIDEINDGLTGWGGAAAQFGEYMPSPLPFPER